MIVVELTYNPYFVTTQIAIDGEVVPDNSPLAKLCKNSRIQNWIDNFLPQLYEERREKEVEFIFRGTELDADDVRNAIELYNREHLGSHFTLKEVIAKEHGASRVTALKELFEKGKQGPFKELFNSPEMEEAFQSAIDPTFEVNVIGTMSSGKSTVVNALLGKKLMPAKNEACTAVIVRIKNNDDAPIFTAQRFDSDHNSLSDKHEATYDLLSEWNNDPQTSIIEIEGNIPTVSQTDECTMVFVDTPGPNNAQNEEHRRITLDAIKNKPLSMVLYMLNMTQLGTNDDRWLLDQVCEAMSAGGRQAQDRFVFLATKIDEVGDDDNDDEENIQNRESVTQILCNTKDYLQRRDENGKIHGIENPLVIPVCAKLAQLIRIKKNQGKLDQKEGKGNRRTLLQYLVEVFTEEKEMNMLEHVRKRLSGDCARRLQKRIDDAADNEAKAEILSGIPIVEELLNDFLQKHAMPAKLKDAVESLNRVMHEAQIAERMNTQLSKDAAAIDAVLDKIKAFKDDKARIEKGKEFRKKINDMNYTISSSTNATLTKLMEKGEKVTHDLNKLLQNHHASKQEAQSAFQKAVQQCRDYDSEVIVCLRKALDTEYYSTLQNMRNEYQEYIVSVLKKSFPDDLELRELESAVMEMPSVNEMINANLKKETKKVRVGSHVVSDSKWYKPWTWGSSHTVDDYENRTEEYVDLTPIAPELTTAIRSASQHNIDGFKEQAKANVEKAKATLLSIMATIDRKIEEVQANLAKAQADKAAKEEMRRKNQEKLDWYNDFHKQLQDILAI